MTATAFALALAALVSPWLIEIFKRYPFVEQYAFGISIVMAFSIAILASVVTGELKPWIDPIGFLGNTGLIFTVATVVYRALIKGKPEVQRLLRGQEK